MSEWMRIQSKIMSKHITHQTETLKKLAELHPEFYDKVKDVNFTKMMTKIMEKALKAAAQKCNGQVTDYVKDVHGNKKNIHNDQKIVGAIQSKNVPMGVGVIVKDTGVDFVYESANTNMKALNELKKTIENMYKAVGLIELMKLVDYDVKVSESDDSKMIIVNAEKERIVH